MIGVVTDAFLEARRKREALDLDNNSRSFVAGVERAAFEAAGGDFDKHVSTEQNVRGRCLLACVLDTVLRQKRPPPAPSELDSARHPMTTLPHFRPFARYKYLFGPSQPL